MPNQGKPNVSKAATEKEKIKILNEMIKIIDEKAASYKDRMAKMQANQFYAEKKLLLDTIDDAVELAKTIKPAPPNMEDIVRDFKKLWNDLSRLRPS
jgi:hypothetical protein